MRTIVFLWLGQLVSMLGTGMTRFAMMLWVWEQTGRATSVALIQVFVTVPALAISPLAGTLVDRWSRKTVLIVSDLVAGLSTVGLLVLYLAGMLEVWHLYAAAALASAAESFQNPAQLASISLIVPKAQHARANGLMQTAQFGPMVLAPVLAGIFLPIIGLRGILVADLLTFLAAAANLLFLHIPQPPEEAGESAGSRSVWRETTEGLRYVLDRRPILHLVLVFTAANLIFGAFSGLLNPMILARTDQDAQVLGYVLGLFGVGGVVGGLGLGLWGGFERRIHGVLLGILGINLLGVLVVSLGRSLVVWAVGAFFVTLFVPIINGSVLAIGQTKIAPKLQGRVFALFRMVAQGSVPLALLVIGPLADHVFEPAMAEGGRLAAIFGGLVGTGPGAGMALLMIPAGLLGVMVAILGYMVPSVRRIEDLLPDHDNAETTLKILPERNPEPPKQRRIDMKSKLQTFVFLAVLLLLTGVAVLDFLRTPEPRLADAPAEVFSAGRAMAHLEVIARQPHPLGTAAKARVRDYLVAEIEALGLEAEIQSVTALHDRLPIGGRVENVLTRLEGREDGPALLVMSHYDSAPSSPGAGDDGAGVAAMLEALRALRAGEPPGRDVIFLFTDGEEAGLLGARAFAEEHPWAAEVGALVNLEARGSRGPALMFETGPGNAPYIAALRRIDPRATSYSYEIYQRMPNDTDYSVFKRRGVPGLNFAFIHDLAAYHSAQDNLERLDRGSLQAHGEAVLGLARELSGLDLGSPELAKRGDAVYFNLPGVFVTYGGGLTLPLAILAGLGTFLALFLAWRRGRFSLGRAGLAFLVLVLGGLLSGGLAFGIFRLAAPRAFGFLLGGWSSDDLLMLAAAVVAGGCALLIATLTRRWGDDVFLGPGMLLFWLLGLALAVVAPGASYLFVWPVIFALPVAFRRWTGSLPDLLLLLLPAVVAAFLWAPSLEVIGAALGSIVVVLIGVLTVWILLAFQAPVLASLLPEKRAFLLPAGILALGLVGIVAVASAAGYNEHNRRQNSMLYFYDAVEDAARWWSLDPRTDDWTRQFLGESPDKGPRPEQLWPSRRGDSWNAPAPALGLAAPAVELLGVEDGGEGRVFRVRLAANYDQAEGGFAVERLTLFLRPLDQVLALRAGGAEVPRHTEPERPTLLFLGPQAAGLDLEITTPPGTESLELDLTVQRHALPEVPGFNPSPRPADTMPRRFTWLGDSTFVRIAQTLEASTAIEEPEGEQP